MEEQSRSEMSTATHLRIKNLKTEEVYTVTASGWQTIVSKGMASKYEVIEELSPLPDRKSHIPQAIKESARIEAERASKDETTK